MASSQDIITWIKTDPKARIYKNVPELESGSVTSFLVEGDIIRLNVTSQERDYSLKLKKIDDVYFQHESKLFTVTYEMFKDETKIVLYG